MKTNTTYLLLGSNMGDSVQMLRSARQFIEQIIGPVTQASKLYTSKAWGETDQPDFINQVLRVETPLDAFETLGKCLKIENDLGRVRFKKWGQRSIDIDILYFNDEHIRTKVLEIPHPHIQDRRFTLIPMTEIAPNHQHPVFHKSQEELLHDCSDRGPVTPVHSPQDSI